MNRYRVNREQQTVDILTDNGEYIHYKRFDELTNRERLKVKSFWVYNL